MIPMADKPVLPCCSITGCEKPVSKAGYTLCYEHWLSSKNSTKSKEKPEAQKETALQGKTHGLLTSTSLGEKLGLSGTKVNQVLAELGWIQKNGKGWSPTEQGFKLKAEAKEHYQTKVPFVLWPEAILASRILQNTANELLGEKSSMPDEAVDHSLSSSQATTGFREKFPPTHRTTDGHWVRSKAETLIDNWLYMSGLVHAYERQVPVEEDLYCDFYIPSGKVYIEYWGLENDPKYAARKKAKLEIYKKYGLNLIELNDEHIRNLDDTLPKMLIKFNVIVS